MSAFESITMTRAPLAPLTASYILLAILPIIFIVFWKVRCKDQVMIKALFPGIACYMVFSMFSQSLVNFLFLASSNPISRFLLAFPIASVLYSATITVLLCEGGRYLLLRYLYTWKNPKENSIMFGIGYGTMEIYTGALMEVMSFISIVLTFTGRSITDAMAALNITEETADAVFPVVERAFAFAGSSLLMVLAERILMLLIHITLTLILYLSIQGKQKNYLYLVFGVHLLIALVPAAAQAFHLPSWITIGWLLIWAVSLSMNGIRLYRETE